MKVKLLGISAGRPEGNTDYLLLEALKAAADLNIAETELINISEKKIEGCNELGGMEKEKWCNALVQKLPKK